MAGKTYYVAKDGELIDEICWRHYGRQSGAVEAVYEANPGLVDIGPALLAGTVLYLPEIAAPTATETVRLWD
ncbi:MAG: tail protein X [Desulfovibrionaceae bacterium]